MINLIKIKEAVIVEGKYDKMRLKNVVDTTIIETNGFRIFKDKEKVNLIKKIADSRGILILTDSDSAGFLIRNYLKGIVPPDKIKNAYIPQIPGKEKRKSQPSKEGTLGVEGIDEEVLREVLEKYCTVNACDESTEKITKQNLFRLGLSGRENSKILRERLLKELDIPSYLTANAMIDALNSIITLEELEKLAGEIEKRN